MVKKLRRASPNEDESGFGFELTFRLARAEAEREPPAWPINLLQNLARYVFTGGNSLREGHRLMVTSVQLTLESIGSRRG